MREFFRFHISRHKTVAGRARALFLASAIFSVLWLGDAAASLSLNSFQGCVFSVGVLAVIPLILYYRYKLSKFICDINLPDMFIYKFQLDSYLNWLAYFCMCGIIHSGVVILCRYILDQNPETDIVSTSLLVVTFILTLLCMFSVYKILCLSYRVKKGLSKEVVGINELGGIL